MTSSQPDTIAILLAAGTGSRFGASLPKQYCRLNGRPLLCTTIDAFRRVLPDQNLRVVISETMQPVWLDLCCEAGFQSPRLIYGGSTRWESVKNAVDSLADMAGDTVVLIHDGARPFPSPRLISEASRLEPGSFGNIPAVAVTDSLRFVDGSCSKAVDRSRFVAVQTPQAFTLSTLRRAYSRPYQPSMTDDASVVEAAGLTPLLLIEGDTFNIKITSPHDLAVAGAISSILAD